MVRSPDNELQLVDPSVRALVRTDNAISVGEAFAVTIELCSQEDVVLLDVDATMPVHGHGMNYQPEMGERVATADGSTYRAEGLLFHMPGEWQWSIKVQVAEQQQTLTHVAQPLATLLDISLVASCFLGLRWIAGAFVACCVVVLSGLVSVSANDEIVFSTEERAQI